MCQAAWDPAVDKDFLIAPSILSADFAKLGQEVCACAADCVRVSLSLHSRLPVSVRFVCTWRTRGMLAHPTCGVFANTWGVCKHMKAPRLPGAPAFCILYGDAVRQQCNRHAGWLLYGKDNPH